MAENYKRGLRYILKEKSFFMIWIKNNTSETLKLSSTVVCLLRYLENGDERVVSEVSSFPSFINFASSLLFSDMEASSHGRAGRSVAGPSLSLLFDPHCHHQQSINWHKILRFLFTTQNLKYKRSRRCTKWSSILLFTYRPFLKTIIKMINLIQI